MVLATALAAPAACSRSSAHEGGGIRLGYFPNITHATAIVGISQGIFAGELGGPGRLHTTVFNAGPPAVQGLFSGALDAAYIGPNPAINAFIQSKGEAVRIIAGATSGGAFLVVKPSITSAEDLRGKRLATPQRGNTQDVALRSWLASRRLSATLAGGGDVSVVSQASAHTLATFNSGAIDGAWVPEPWASRLVLEGGGRVLQDERALWPGGRYATTVLLVRTAFLQSHPDRVRALLRGHLRADAFVNRHPVQARRLVGDALARLTGKGLPAAVLERAWVNLTFTVDPVVSSLHVSAANAARLKLLERAPLGGIADLGILNELLHAAGKPEVAA